MDFRQDPRFDMIATSLEESRGLPPGILKSLVGAESSGNPMAKSKAGAYGLTQFMPATAKQYNVNLDDPADQMRGAADYLQDLTHQYDGNVRAAVSAYNGGKYNAAYQVDGTIPDALHVSPQNHEINKAYVDKVVGGISPVTAAPPQLTSEVQQLRDYVNKSLASDNSSALVINNLLQNGYSKLVREGTAAGLSSDDLISKIGGEAAVKIIRDRQEVDKQNVLQNTAQSAGNAISDAGLSFKQIIAPSGSPEEAALRAEQAANLNDPRRHALSHTFGGSVGAEVPGLALNAGAALATGGASIPMMIAGQAAAGVARKALTPVTKDGERTTNMIEGGIGDALAMGLPVVGGKALGYVVPKMLGRTGEYIADKTALAEAFAKHDLPINASTLTNTGKNLINSMEGSGDVIKLRQTIDTNMARQAAKELGVDGWAGGINHDLLNQARPAYQKLYADSADTVSGKISNGLANDISGLVSETTNPLTAGVSDLTALRKYADNISGAARSGANISGRDLQQLSRELKDITRNQSAAGSERKIAGEIAGKIDDHLNTLMTPEQQLNFTKANQQFAATKAVEKMVAAAGDSGVVKPNQMINAIKSGQFKNAFLRGDAPFQEYGRTLVAAAGPGNGRGLGAIMGKVVSGVSNNVIGMGSLYNPLGAAGIWAGKTIGTKLAAKLATSTNPTVVKLLTGVDVKKLAGKSSTSSLAKNLVAAQAIDDSTPAVNISNATTQVAKSQKLAEGMKAIDPLRLGYEPTKPPTIMVDGAGRASADENALFAARFAAQKADVIEVPVTEVKAAPVVEEAPTPTSKIIDNLVNKDSSLKAFTTPYVVPDAIRGPIDSFTSNKTRSVLVHGKPGTGKTSLMNDYLERNPDANVVYLTKSTATPAELKNAHASANMSEKTLVVADEADTFTPTQAEAIRELGRKKNVSIIYTTNDLKKVNPTIVESADKIIDTNINLTPSQKKVFGLSVAKRYGIDLPEAEIVNRSLSGKSFRDIKRAVTDGADLKGESLFAQEAPRSGNPTTDKIFDDFVNNRDSKNLLIIDKANQGLEQHITKVFPDTPIDDVVPFIAKNMNSSMSATIYTKILTQSEANKLNSIKGLIERSNETTHPVKIIVSDPKGLLDDAMKSRGKQLDKPKVAPAATDPKSGKSNIG